MSLSSFAVEFELVAFKLCDNAFRSNQLYMDLRGVRKPCVAARVLRLR